MATLTPFDPDAYKAHTDAIIATFTPELVESLIRFGSSSERPIFVTGMPGSATTLVEQVLASHPRVHGAGELDLIHHSAASLGERAGVGASYPEAMADLDADAVTSIAADLEAAFDTVSNKADRVTDKSISTYRHLGFAACLFPKARFIHCVRDPLDTCLSCYQQRLVGAEHAYSYDLGHLGAVYGEYVRLMEHWRSVLPVEILDVRYEDLVADQEAQSRRLVEFCGLEWDDACLEFYTADREVRTASRWQVRQPIYASSIGRWKNYREHLERLRAALGDTVG